MEPSQATNQLLEDNSVPEEEDEGSFSSNLEVYRRLQQSVRNEDASPELLPLDEPVLNHMLEQVDHVDGILKQYKNRLDPLMQLAHTFELERIRFIIHRYYRVRLEKIEKTAPYLVNLYRTSPRTVYGMMSPGELKFLDRFMDSKDNLLQKLVLDHMPSNMQSFKSEDVQFNPQHEFECKYVFVEALKETTVVVDDPVTGQDMVEMKAGSKHFLPYSAVRNLLKKGSNVIVLI